jgi:hypothetical protein
MTIEDRFATKLDSLDEVPEPLRGALIDNFLSPESVRLLIHAPAFLTSDERSPTTGPRVTPTVWRSHHTPAASSVARFSCEPSWAIRCALLSRWMPPMAERNWRSSLRLVTTRLCRRRSNRCLLYKGYKRGIGRCAGIFRCFFEKKNSRQFASIHLF